MRKLLLLTPLLFAGCMSPNDPDARTHCIITWACLDIAANHEGPGFFGGAQIDPYVALSIIQLNNTPRPFVGYHVQPIPHTYAPLTVVPYFK